MLQLIGKNLKAGLSSWPSLNISLKLGILSTNSELYLSLDFCKLLYVYFQIVKQLFIEYSLSNYITLFNFKSCYRFVENCCRKVQITNKKSLFQKCLS